MALRTPLSVTPHLYMGDSTGRPLDKGVVYFGEQDKDPEFYPINLFSDDALTKPLAQPVHTKCGYLYDKGDMVEPHAKEIIYSVKVLDSYGRKVFYKGAMMRNSWNDDVISQIGAAIIESQTAAVIAAEIAVQDAINNTAVEGGVLADTFVTATANGVGTIARTQRDKNSDTVSVKDFGAKGDGAVDDSMPVQAAIDYCELEGTTLHIPKGLYVVTNISIKCSIKADSGAVFKNKDSSTTSVISTTQATGLIIDGLTVDGNVSADPEVWSELNYDTFTGGRCLSIGYATVACKFLNCIFRNGKRNNVYIEKSRDLAFINCVFDKARGNFGDCVYHRESVGTKFINCRASDFTRIGFVCETGSRNVTFSSCVAKNGHHSSNNFGGGEYNGGFWAENSHDISYIDCYAEDTGSEGFVATAGRYENPQSNTPSFIYYGCTSRNVTQGFAFRTFSVKNADGSPIQVASHARYYSCKTTQSANAFLGVLNAPNSIMHIEGCHIESNLGAYTISTSTFNINGESSCRLAVKNCVIDRVSVDVKKVYAADNNIADFATYDVLGKNSMMVDIDSLRCLDGSPVYIKYRYGQPNIEIKNCSNIVGGDSFCGDLIVRNCNLKYFVFKPKGDVNIDGCNITLSNSSIADTVAVPHQATPFWINDQSGAKDIRLTNNIVNADGKSLFISNRQSTGTSGRYIFNSNIVRADVTVGTRSALRFQLKDAGSDKVLIHKNTFINSNQAGTAILPFIKTESASAIVSSELNVFDATAKKVIDVNGAIQEVSGSNISTAM